VSIVTDKSYLTYGANGKAGKEPHLFCGPT
jgi:hypothetical protein